MQPINFVKTTTESNNWRKGVNRFFLLIQHFIYKIVGLSPWTLDTSKNYQNQEVISKFSWIGSLYNGFVTSLITAFDYYYQMDGFIGEDPTDNDKDDTVDDLDEPQSIFDTLTDKIAFITVIGVCSILLLYIFRQKSMISVINRLNIIDKTLKQCTKFEPSRISSYFIFLVNIAISCGIMLLVALNSSLRKVISEITPAIISSWVIVQYTLLLIVVEERFKIVNSIIYKMGDFGSDSTRKPTLLLVNVSILRDSICQNIDIIKNAYVELCDICDQITDFFGIPILVSIMYFSQGGIYILYDIITSSLKEKPSKLVYYSIMLIYFVWTVVLFLILTSSVSRTTSEVRFNFISRNIE